MPPSSTLTTLRLDLAGSLQEYDLDMAKQGFIGHLIAPPIDVAKPFGKYGKIPIEQLLKPVDTKRESGADYKRADYTFTDASFSCEEHGLEEAVDERDALMYDDYFDAELLAAQRCRAAVLRNFEARWAAAIFNGTTWTGSSLTTAVTNGWGVAASATPVTDVEGAAQYVFANSGLVPNALIMGWKTFRNLRLVTTSNQIVDRIKYSGHYNPAQEYITAEVLAEVFGVKHIFVAGSIYNSAKEGQTASLASVWSNDYCMVCRIAETNDVREPCLARTFHWSQDGSTMAGTIESYDKEENRSTMVRCRMDVDEVVMYTEAGHLLTNVNAGVA